MRLPPSHKRIQDTVVAIADELTKDDLVLRYRVTGTDTGIAGEEGAFTICSFWLVSALAMIGETDRARSVPAVALSRRAAPALRRGDRHGDRGASGQLPPRPSRTWR